jgi:hypothetical protein
MARAEGWTSSKQIVRSSALNNLLAATRIIIQQAEVLREQASQINADGIASSELHRSLQDRSIPAAS